MNSFQRSGAMKILHGSNFLCPYLYAEPVVCFKQRTFMSRYTLSWHWWAFICLGESEAQKVKEKASTADFELSQPPRRAVCHSIESCSTTLTSNGQTWY